jgi:uncharacterized membrane protein
MIGVLLVAFLHIISWLDPKLRRSLQQSDRMHAVLQILRVAFAGLFDAIVAVQIAAALDHTLPIGRIIQASILILFATLGNYLPNLRPNYFIGIRTPWTLESPDTWRATHRLAGRLMFFGAVFLFILQFFISAGIFGTLFAGFLLLVAVWALLYSWFHYRACAAPHKTL